MSTKVFTKADLENIDYDATSRECLEGYWTVGGFRNVRLYRQHFDFILKDGRKFRCNQDLDRTFTIHSDKYGDVTDSDLWGKMAADIINDNDKFVVIVETVKNVRDFTYDNNYDCNIYSGDEFISDAMTQILDRHYYYNSDSNLLYELVEMGLDENIDYVTITSIDE